jgi:hypothetical protein
MGLLLQSFLGADETAEAISSLQLDKDGLRCK